MAEAEGIAVRGAQADPHGSHAPANDRVAVLVPCFNEETAIATVVADFRAALPEATVYVYDNNSTDRTAAKARAAEAQQKAAVAAAYRQRLEDSGITPEGLVELIDASDRFDLAPLTVKLAEIAVEGRHLRVFETSDPNLLLVKEKKGPIHEDYAIERDEGVVADLRLYAQMP